MPPRCHDIPRITDHSCEPDGCVEDTHERDRTQTYGEGDCAVSVTPFTLTLTAGERQLLDCLTSENINLGATDLKYYPLDLGLNAAQLTLEQNQHHAERAALYGEPHFTPLTRGPYDIRGVVSFESKAAEAMEEGMTMDFRMSVEIARTEFERLGLTAPREGDILQLFDIPFYAQWGQPFRNPGPSGGFYFETLNVEAMGQVGSGDYFSIFKLSLKRDSRYNPERKIFGDVE